MSGWEAKKEEEKEEDRGWWQQVKKEEGRGWWQQAKHADDEEAGGICRQPAPWAATKGHMANSDREQRVPGRAWVTSSAEKVWTHAETGVTYASQ